MRIRTWKTLFLFAVIALVVGLAVVPVQVAFAQGGEPSADDTPTPTVTPTNTPTATPTTPATATPTNTPTNTPEVIAPTPRPTPPPPQPIPEPVTTILFGTGLAALSGVIAARRRKK